MVALFIMPVRNLRPDSLTKRARAGLCTPFFGNIVPMTDRLYYTDSYTHRFNAQLVEHVMDGSHPAVVLDRTYFYPKGGGQPNDNGLIAGVDVLDVNSRDDH